MGKLTESEIKKLQSIDIEMAEVFVEFCNRNKLLCYLCGGGCIGAIRHHGMIPWDDDLDFFMPREDYEKAIVLWQEEMRNTPYALEISDKNHVDHNLFFTIRDRRTTYIKPYQKDEDIVHGVVLDVLPLDGYPDKKFQRRMQCFWALVYSLYCAQIVPKNHGKLITLIGRIALFLVPLKNIRYHIWKYAEKKMTQYKIQDCSGITELCSGPGYMKNRYAKEIFEKAVFVPFADTKMPIPIGYDSYLRTVFGDYMELPPVEKRVGQHDALYMDLNVPYTEYKGKYYCLKEKEQ